MTRCSNHSRPPSLEQITHCHKLSSIHSVMDGHRSRTTDRTQAWCTLTARCMMLVTVVLIKTTVEIIIYRTVRPPILSTPWVVSIIHHQVSAAHSFRTRVTMLDTKIMMDASFRIWAVTSSSNSSKQSRSLAPSRMNRWELINRINHHSLHPILRILFKTSRIVSTIWCHHSTITRIPLWITGMTLSRWVRQEWTTMFQPNKRRLQIASCKHRINASSKARGPVTMKDQAESMSKISLSLSLTKECNQIRQGHRTLLVTD